MALNKARTSIWMKSFIIVLIVAFVSAFMAGGVAGLFDLFQSSGTSASSSTSSDPVTAINDRGQATVDALKNVAASNPASFTAQVNVGNAYFDWAQELSTPASGQSQITTPAMEAALNTWMQARAAYDAAAKLTKTFDPNFQTDRAISTFYSNDATTAIKLAREVVTKKADFAPAWLNLGLFYDATGNTAKAVEGYTKYIQLDPTGQSVSYASNRLKAFGASVPATKTP